MSERRTARSVRRMSGLVDAARGVLTTVAAHADEGEVIRRLPAAVVEALRDEQLMRMCVPAVYGGPEADSSDQQLNRSR